MNFATDRFHRLAKRVRTRFCPKYPLWFFHHVPKCAGTTLRDWLSWRMVVLPDYRQGWSAAAPEPYDVTRLRSAHCICGHFELDGSRLWERYPMAQDGRRARVFTFLREPFALQVSLWKYEQSMGLHPKRSLEESLMRRPNYIAGILQANETNWKSVLNRYGFVGIIEKPELSLERLAAFLGKRIGWLDRLNRSTKELPPTAEHHDPEIRREFMRRNALDYRIYDTALENFNNTT